MNVFQTALAGGMRRGLGALALSLNKSLFRVGEAPSYAISGATPNSAISWSSTRDGQSTGENQSSYGQTADANGVWSGSGNTWTSDQLGWWTKTASANGENATQTFQVVPAVSASAAPIGAAAQPAQSASWWSGSTSVLGYDVPTWALYGGAALLAYVLFLKKR